MPKQLVRSIVATFREITTHDIVLRPPKALTIKIAAGEATLPKTLKVKIVSADPRGGQPTPVRLSAADGGASCEWQMD